VVETTLQILDSINTIFEAQFPSYKLYFLFSWHTDFLTF